MQVGQIRSANDQINTHLPEPFVEIFPDGSAAEWRFISQIPQRDRSWAAGWYGPSQTPILIRESRWPYYYAKARFQITQRILDFWGTTVGPNHIREARGTLRPGGHLGHSRFPAVQGAVRVEEKKKHVAMRKSQRPAV